MASHGVEGEGGGGGVLVTESQVRSCGLPEMQKELN